MKKGNVTSTPHNRKQTSEVDFAAPRGMWVVPQGVCEGSSEGWGPQQARNVAGPYMAHTKF